MIAIPDLHQQLARHLELGGIPGEHRGLTTDDHHALAPGPGELEHEAPVEVTLARQRVVVHVRALAVLRQDPPKFHQSRKKAINIKINHNHHRSWLVRKGSRLTLWRRRRSTFRRWGIGCQRGARPPCSRRSREARSPQAPGDVCRGAAAAAARRPGTCRSTFPVCPGVARRFWLDEEVLMRG